MKTLAIILMTAGLALSIFTTVSFFSKEKVANLGKLEITTDKQHKFNWSPLVGIGIFSIGGVLFWQSTKK